MNILLAACFITCLPFSQAKSIDFGDDDHIPVPPKIVNMHSPQSEGNPECSCVPKEMCGDPGFFGPRDEARVSNRVRISFDDSGEQETKVVSYSKIYNKPPIVCAELGSVCCVNILTPSSTIVPWIQPDNQFSCGTRTILSQRRSSTEAKFGEYPWMALIFLAKSDKLTLLATGALLDEFTVLTTAHNIQTYSGDSSAKLLVRVGEFNLNDQVVDPYPFVQAKVADIKIHKYFNSYSLDNDIALVRLDRSCRAGMSPSPNINTVCLPQQDTMFTNESCWVAGYGKTESSKHSEVLRHVDLKVLDRSNCEGLLQKSFLGKSFKLKDSFVCAGGEAGKDACAKDGGSALVCLRSGRWVVAGLVSWGIECGLAGFPGVYVNVPKYVNWIEANRT